MQAQKFNDLLRTFSALVGHGSMGTPNLMPMSTANPTRQLTAGVCQNLGKFEIVVSHYRRVNAMNVIVDLCVVPLGVGVSVGQYVAACQKVLAEAGLKHTMHAYGTNIEGDWDEVFAAVKACHEAVHALGAPRITSSMRFGTRTDRPQTMEEKVKSVETWLENS